MWSGKEHTNFSSLVIFIGSKGKQKKNELHMVIVMTLLLQIKKL